MVPGDETARGHIYPDVSPQPPPPHSVCHSPSLLSYPAPQGSGPVPSSRRLNVSMAMDQ